MHLSFHMFRYNIRNIIVQQINFNFFDPYSIG
jgi:hypothetical protein